MSTLETVASTARAVYFPAFTILPFFIIGGVYSNAPLASNVFNTLSASSLDIFSLLILAAIRLTSALLITLAFKIVLVNLFANAFSSAPSNSGNKSSFFCCPLSIGF